MSDQKLATLALHADGDILQESDIAPPIHLSTTFRYLYNAEHEGILGDHHYVDAINDRDAPFDLNGPPTRTRFEAVLSALVHSPTLTYSSGVAAVHAYLVLLKPKCVAIGDGYYGSRQVVNLYQQLTGCETLTFDDLDTLQKGDVIHLETPTNPTGEATSIKEFARKAHEWGAYLFVDSTFGPPGLQDPFALGADVVMHSGTKYFGGHHDLLCGTLSIRPERKDDWFKKLQEHRTILGNVLGSMEGWLGLRSLRTLELRISECLKGESDKIIKNTIDKDEDMHWLREQMPNGFGGVFALEMKTEEMTRKLPGLLTLFQHATSLGGVESQVEWRRLVDSSAKPTLLRFSIGVENLEDLKADLLYGLKELIDK
ncbi:pyridoxal phosphate-dependent transferase [Xylogone sp. PMI_703]|nr:pyridoxal phosphate-dependent transferase [Xylogone sp. PMI_703]